MVLARRSGLYSVTSIPQQPKGDNDEENKIAEVIFSCEGNTDQIICQNKDGDIPQAAFISLSLDGGKIDAFCDTGYGDMPPEYVLRGVVRRYHILPSLTCSQVEEVIQILRPCFQRILNGYELKRQDEKLIGTLSGGAENISFVLLKNYLSWSSIKFHMSNIS